MMTIMVPDLLPATDEICKLCLHVVDDLHDVHRLIVREPSAGLIPTTMTPRGASTSATASPALSGRSTRGQVANSAPAAVSIEYSMCVPR